MAGRGGTARTNGAAASNKICQFKLVLLGESAVGKSSLVLRFVKGQFHEYQESTIGGLCFHLNCCFFHHTCPSLPLCYNNIVIIAQPSQVSSRGTLFSSFILCSPSNVFQCTDAEAEENMSLPAHTCLSESFLLLTHVQGRAAEPVLSRRSPISPISQQAPHTAHMYNHFCRKRS